MNRIATIVIFLCCFAGLKSQTRQNCDSATIIFKNVHTTEIEYIHAVIKGVEVGVWRLAAGKESKPFKISTCNYGNFRFTIYLSVKEELKDSIEPMDYGDQVSKEEILKGTYMYSIGYNESGLKITLKKKE
jgi:hypothetical protein